MMDHNRKTHCILLYQISHSSDSRGFLEFMSVTDLIEGVKAIFEEYFKAIHPTCDEICYGLDDVLKFVDGVDDMSCLIHNHKKNVFLPYCRDWIKEKIYNNMRYINNV